LKQIQEMPGRIKENGSQGYYKQYKLTKNFIKNKLLLQKTYWKRVVWADGKGVIHIYVFMLKIYLNIGLGSRKC